MNWLIITVYANLNILSHKTIPPIDFFAIAKKSPQANKQPIPQVANPKSRKFDNWKLSENSECSKCSECSY